MLATPKFRIALSLATTLCGIVSYAVLAGDGKLFSHKRHLQEGAECSNCHDVSATDRSPTLKTGGCTDCHDQAAPKYSLPGKARPLHLGFPHKLHTDAGECKKCHAKTVNETAAAGELVIPVTDCFSCHKENGVDTPIAQCGKCHGSDKSKERPGDHGKNWAREHPQTVAGGEPAGHGKNCSLCHGSDSCLVCHQKRKPFSHKLHIDERSAECSNCHVWQGVPGLPKLKPEGCQDCHKGEVQTKKIKGRAQRLRIRFPHPPHASAMKCSDCHGKTLRDNQPSGEWMVAGSACFSCHAESGVDVPEASCAKCHGQDQRRVRPKDHEKLWSIKHGQESQWRVFDEHGQQCSLCHRADACLTCHKNSRPRSHTSLWRIRTHGITAGWERDSCRTCHESGGCERCHRTTTPINHKGAWGATHGLAAAGRDNEHCAVCHNLGWCAACHSGRGK